MLNRCLALLALVLAVAPASAQKDKVVKPDRDWIAVVRDTKLSKLAPKDGIITTAKEFEKLWKAWRKDEKVPAIDFTKKLAVVTLSLGGPNTPTTTARLDGNGNLQIEAVSELVGGEAFGYSIAVYPRTGIKKVNGKPIQ